MRNKRLIILLSLIAISSFGIIGQVKTQSSEPVSIEEEGYMYMKEDEVINAKEVLIAGITKEKIEELAKTAENTPEGAFILYLNAMIKRDNDLLKKYLLNDLIEGFEKATRLLILQDSGQDILNEQQEKYMLFYAQINIYEKILQDDGKWSFDIVSIEYLNKAKTEAVVKLRYNYWGEGIDKGRHELYQFNYLLIKEKGMWKFAWSKYSISQIKKLVKEYPELVKKEKQRWADREERYKRERQEEEKRRKENK